MNIRGLTADQLRVIVEKVSDEQYEGNIIFNREPEWKKGWWIFTLRVKNSKGPGAKHSALSGKRTVACCWHAHRDVMKEIFERFPNAELLTAMAQYRGKEGFEENFRQTAYKNVGSLYCPAEYQHCCEC